MTITLSRLDLPVTDAPPASPAPLSEVTRKFRRDELAPKATRNFAADFLATHCIDIDVIDTAVLLVDEIVTNSVLYANRGQITVQIAIGDKQIRFDVTDAGRSRADVALESEFDEDSEGGRGWFIVAKLAVECGIERLGGGNGNRVHFLLNRDSGGAS